MNIYIHVEVASRELDSKILLALLAANNGHEVLIANTDSIAKGIDSNILNPGIFHTKSLTGSEVRIKKHNNLIKKKFKITSIDEEGGLVDNGYKDFAINRYSKDSLNQAAAVFCWGDEDFETLNKMYANFSNKIFKTGSPRVDLWRGPLLNYWSKPAEISKKPYLLISSNCSNYLKPFYQKFISEKKNGYFKSNPDRIEKIFGDTGEGYIKTGYFINAIKYIVKKSNNEYDIVLRPHPSEDINIWKIFLDGIPNVKVIAEGPINKWIKHAFAVFHNGCTTAFEAIISEKPLITYVPFKINFSGQIPNKLGYRVSSLKKLSSIINAIYKNRNNPKVNKIPKIVKNKIYIDKKNLSAEKIIKVWEKINDGFKTSKNNWFVFSLFLKIQKFKNKLNYYIYKLSFRKFGYQFNNKKFLPLCEKDIKRRIKVLKNLLNIKENIECKLLSDKCILIKKL